MLRFESEARKKPDDLTTLTQDGGRTSTSEVRNSSVGELHESNAYEVFVSIESETVTDVVRSAGNPTLFGYQMFLPRDGLNLISHCQNVRLTRK